MLSQPPAKKKNSVSYLATFSASSRVGLENWEKIRNPTDTRIFCNSLLFPTMQICNASGCAVARCLIRLKLCACPCPPKGCPYRPRRTSRWCRNWASPSGSWPPTRGRAPGGPPPGSLLPGPRSCGVGTSLAGHPPWAASAPPPAGSWLCLRSGLQIQQPDMSNATSCLVKFQANILFEGAVVLHLHCM